MKNSAWGLVVAAGKDEMMEGGVEAPFLYLNDRPVLAYSLAAFQQCAEIEGVVVVIPADRAEGLLGMIKMFGFSKIRKVVGGKTRRGLFMSDALSHIDRGVDVVCVHGASEPMVTAELIGETVKCARRQGNGIAAVALAGPVLGGVKRNVAGGIVVGGGGGWMAVSPQSFRTEVLRKIYADRGRTFGKFPDEVTVLEAMGEAIRVVPAGGPFIRLRRMEDMDAALALVKPFAI